MFLLFRYVSCSPICSRWVCPWNWLHLQNGIPDSRSAALIRRLLSAAAQPLYFGMKVNGWIWEAGDRSPLSLLSRLLEQAEFGGNAGIPTLLTNWTFRYMLSAYPA
ncbi:hypothetical protein D3C74_366340 [compost metagenome]